MTGVRELSPCSPWRPMVEKIPTLQPIEEPMPEQVDICARFCYNSCPPLSYSLLLVRDDRFFSWRFSYLCWFLLCLAGGAAALTALFSSLSAKRTFRRGFTWLLSGLKWHSWEEYLSKTSLSGVPKAEFLKIRLSCPVFFNLGQIFRKKLKINHTSQI